MNQSHSTLGLVSLVLALATVWGCACSPLQGAGTGGYWAMGASDQDGATKHNSLQQANDLFGQSQTHRERRVVFEGDPHLNLLDQQIVVGVRLYGDRDRGPVIGGKVVVEVTRIEPLAELAWRRIKAPENEKQEIHHRTEDPDSSVDRTGRQNDP